MRSLAIAAAAALLGTAGAGALAADAGETLAKNSGCLACHTVNKKLIGPSYQDVAKKYRNDKKAPDYLAKKIKEGGAGVWGQVPMSPNAHVKDADIKTIVAWILSLK
ncbi:MAG: c-type cytochrome [Burkholderiales bacterium]|nr:c-type cytochrome [Burkholderiales bacterium]